ncbi:hypothetical protein L345_12824, partial [Ophiophagus hannah]
IHRKVHARLLFAAYLSPTDFILLERIESKFLKAILQQAVSSLKQCVIDVERQLGFLTLPRDIFITRCPFCRAAKYLNQISIPCSSTNRSKE